MTKLGRATERMMGMSDATWERHVNPWSGWTRVATLPLMTIAVWSRVWIGWWSLLPIATVCLWVWINPRLFPPPKSTENWMSRGVLGERIWLANEADTIADHHRRVIKTLMWVSGLGGLIFLVGLICLDLTSTLVGMSCSMLGKLWFIDRMVWIFYDQRDR